MVLTVYSYIYLNWEIMVVKNVRGIFGRNNFTIKLTGLAASIYPFRFNQEIFNSFLECSLKITSSTFVCSIALLDLPNF